MAHAGTEQAQAKQAPAADYGGTGDTDETIRERLTAFVARLADDAKRRVDKRNTIEQRWIEDLQQYHGIYDRDVIEKIKKTGGSQIFINLTATKTDALEARLWDLLFPTDDRNWGISPTPVPELTDQAEAALLKVDDATKRVGAAQAEAVQFAQAGQANEAEAAGLDANAAQAEVNAAQEAADDLQDTLNEAKRRCDLMMEEIDDQLVTAGFQSEARDLISDACKMGIGIIKGPVLEDNPTQLWVKTEIE